jgi:hypothetical protein
MLAELEVENNGTIEGREFNSSKSLTGKENVKIINCTFKSNEEDEDQLHLSNCTGCVILKCNFLGKHTVGLALNIDGYNSKNNWVVGCTFSDLIISKEYEEDWKERRKKANKKTNLNAEPIRLGGSPVSGCWFGTTVSWCLFDKLKADAETISIKSCGNVIENNKHVDCDSNFTIRHGGYNKIRNNVFIGSGGIRVYGYQNEIKGNYHKDNNSDRPPLIVGTGTLENDPNFDDKGEPPVNDKKEHINKKGCSHAVYARAKSNVIQDNQYDNCSPCVLWDTGYNELDDDDKKEKKCEVDDKVIKTYHLKEYFPPINNDFSNNKARLDSENKDSTFIFCKTPKQEKELTNPEYKNTFQGNKLQNIKHGFLPKEPHDSEEPITPNMPPAGPDKMPPEYLEQNKLPKLRSS